MHSKLICPSHGINSNHMARQPAEVWTEHEIWKGGLSDLNMAWLLVPNGLRSSELADLLGFSHTSLLLHASLCLLFQYMLVSTVQIYIHIYILFFLLKFCWSFCYHFDGVIIFFSSFFSLISASFTCINMFLQRMQRACNEKLWNASSTLGINSKPLYA